MACQRRAQVFAIEQEEFSQAFESGITLPLGGPNRSVPTVLSADNCLRIPVGTFDQANGNRRSAPLSPRGEHSQVVCGVAQVGLYGDPHICPVAKLGLHQNSFEDSQSEVLETTLLHVEMDERALGYSQT